ncbi:nuclear transport factor 2 family protein [Nocardia sp. NPDC088792]|uniref:nuclear transport factor 2 family protein n=1 Tax=Nocardia sp. NPDC088792 TaxID=3364332 RepID=UPI0038238C32
MKREATTARTIAAAVALGLTATAVLAACDSDKPKAEGTPAIAADWGAAWKDSNPQHLAGLFTQDGARYSDHAFGRTYNGRDGIAQWAINTHQFVQGANIKVDNAFGTADQVAISWTFTGQLAGAPKPFSVPAVAVLKMRGKEIVTDDDYYNLADVLHQSGLPADLDLG